jgi:hypothetical protein
MHSVTTPDDVTTLKAVSVGKLKKIKIWHNNSGSLKQTLVGGDAKWLCERVIVHDSTIPADVVFPCGKWFDREHGFSHDLVPASVVAAKEAIAAAPVPKMARYQISTLTNSKPDSGTIANVFLRMHGIKGRETRKLELDESLTSDILFEPGQRDTFVFRCEDLGLNGPKSVSVWHESMQDGDEWRLDSIMVKDLTHKKLHRFNFGVDGTVFAAAPNMVIQPRGYVTLLVFMQV